MNNMYEPLSPSLNDDPSFAADYEKWIKDTTAYDPPVRRNIIFLDFDGPLTNERCYQAFDKPAGRKMWTTADPVAISFINQLCEEFKALVVLSTTWRRTSLTPTRLSAQDSLRLWGFKGQFHIDSETPDLVIDGRSSRNDEIMTWIENHRETVNNYVSIDDLYLAKYTNNVIVTTSNGMMIADYDKARGMLSGGGYSVDKGLEKWHG